MNDAFNFNAPARTYEVQPDGRAMLRVMLTYGEQAHCVTPWHTGKDPMILSAAEIARDADIPVNELPGREFTATGDEHALRDFRLVDDPRL
ncbi:hypothetical protein D5S18_18545 [Nocardia panacis]|uniref:Uncharacterized protein n=1 Tax=Nocardia panacis TaxID=2340916 RepID=A0A3A4JVC2_9NOCA|nr:hypothetical protein [Nocardia panacis]RJO74153.1 hypothetical protein D5S18_18545 [Nocardia panacis]